MEQFESLNVLRLVILPEPHSATTTGHVVLLMTELQIGVVVFSPCAGSLIAQHFSHRIESVDVAFLDCCGKSSGESHNKEDEPVPGHLHVTAAPASAVHEISRRKIAL